MLRSMRVRVSCKGGCKSGSMRVRVSCKGGCKCESMHACVSCKGGCKCKLISFLHVTRVLLETCASLPIAILHACACVSVSACGSNVADLFVGF
jgi:hypothetical protein